jgi:CheY-like chemotaxis protein
MFLPVRFNPNSTEKTKRIRCLAHWHGPCQTPSKAKRITRQARNKTMRKRLLVVDDDSSVRESLKKVLEETGYEVILASDGGEAAGRLKETQLDLLILDLNMPRRDGWDVLEDASVICPLVPVIIITGNIDQLDSLSIPGVAILLEKPIEVPILLETIADMIAQGAEERLRTIQSSLEADSWYRITGGEHADSSGSISRSRPAGDSFAS